MKKLLSLVILFLMITSVALADSDTKMSNHYLLQHKVNSKIDAYLWATTGFRSNVEELNSYFIREGFTYHAHKNLDIGLSHLFFRVQNIRGVWLNENRAELSITPKTAVGKFRLLNRGMFEYRWFEVGKDKTRYRNLSLIAYPIFAYTPYLSEEFFYGFKERKIAINWFTFGVDKKIATNVTLGLFYRHENARRGLTSKWDNNGIIGTKIVLTF